MASQAALTAKAIKAEVKTIAKNVTVRAKSSIFSMGDSVDVTVIGEITPEVKDQIRKLEYKYRYGHFDGMEDMYECSNNRSDIPQAKYVFIEFRLAA